MIRDPLGPFRKVGAWTYFVRDIGRALGDVRTYGSETIRQMRNIGVDSVPLAAIVAAFIGAVTAIQTRYQLFGGVQLSVVGLISRQSVILELGPLLTGLVLTDEIRVTIAGQACLLLLHRETDYYAQLVSILVYPTGYIADEERYMGGGIWQEGGEHRLGHTGHHLGALVLAWDAVRKGAAEPNDGVNLVLHEFAHQLDFENRSSDGTPALETSGDYRAWARVMSAEFDALREAADSGEDTFLDDYGATNPSEFFAVITEAFFERPRALRHNHPALFMQLQRFYQQDPTTYSLEAIGAS